MKSLMNLQERKMLDRYALSQFAEAITNVYSKEEMEDTEFLFNLETISAFHVVDQLIDFAANSAEIAAPYSGESISRCLSIWSAMPLIRVR